MRPLLLLTCLLLGCWGADTGQSPDGGGNGRVPRGDVSDVSMEDIVGAAAAEFESRARAAANATVDRLEERLAGLEKHLSEHAVLLAETAAAVAQLSETVSEWERSGRQAMSADQSDGAAGRPQPSDRARRLTGHVLGEPCRLDSECSDLLTDTQCYGGRCVCGRGLLRGPGETCHPAPWLGGECRIDRHCRVRTKEAVCSGRVCQCPADRMTYFEECRRFPRLSESCRTDTDCRSATRHSLCSRLTRRCECQRGFWNHANRQCREGVSEGGPCRYDRDCNLVKSINTCVDGVCQVRQCDAHPGSTDRFRLIGGNSCDNGYVEFTYDSGESWNFLCDSNWTNADATVLCAYMGYDWGEPSRPNVGSSQNVTRFLWVDDLECDGTEPNLTLCVWNEGRTNCEVGEVAAVQCFMYPTEPPSTEQPAAEEAEAETGDGDDVLSGA